MAAPRIKVPPLVVPAPLLHHSMLRTSKILCLGATVRRTEQHIAGVPGTIRAGLCSGLQVRCSPP